MKTIEMECDACFKKVEELFDVLPLYASEGISEICKDCADDMSSCMTKINEIFVEKKNKRIRLFLINRRAHYELVNAR